MVVLGLIWLLATGTLTYAAGRQLATKAPQAQTAAVTPRPTLVVPDIRGQAFVFAKGILEDSGFGWRVTGGVQGYATNVVATQQPAPGTRVQDTGAPMLKLTLRHGTYGQDGHPENTAPYAGTSVVLEKSAAAAAKKPAAAAKKTVVRKAVAKPAVKRARRAAANPKRKLVPHKRASVRRRRAAFTVPGAPKEPLDEIPLPQRADRLARWIDSRPQRTTSNVQHWLYQHAWIVTGAGFGWSHGDDALVKLIAADRQVERMWGLGYRSEAVARATLAEVRRRER
jgi:PASTA domain